ncbi:MAG TPA: AAA family ATPase [Streptosporangiaceae bacterium]|jgi:DNA-binding CsgD family transcriptional regulator
MAAGLVSPVFAGREAELALLASALADASGGTPRTVLTGAEAGGGKSRLITEFAATAGDRALILTGGCVGLGAGGLPYAPFTAALRQLVRARGAAEVAGLLPGQAAGELGVLLPGFGAPPAGADPGTSRARLFEVLLTLLETLAEQQPVVLVVEDVHWADRPTCDLLSFLVRNIRQARVLLVVTFRSDELNRSDLLRPLLAGLARADGVARLELARLSRAQAAAQLAGILGRAPGAALISEVYQRGGGVPLLTEALVNADGTVSAGLPTSLRDLLLAAVAVLPERTQQVLRIAAAGGARLSHSLLTAVTGLDNTSLTAALRPAVDARVLVSDADGYAFRHQLIREAVLEELLPGERAQAHRSFAVALEARLEAGARAGPESTLVVLAALHWRGAADDERALAAAWRAAVAAGTALAYAQRLRMLEQVLDLWDRVPGPARPAGLDHVGVLELAADAARWAGEPERGLTLAETAIAELGTAGDTERMALLLRRRAGLRQELLRPGQLDDLQAALRLAAAPNLVRAQVLARLCWALKREDRLAESERMALDLGALAAQLGDEEHRIEASMVLASLGALRGEDTMAALLGAQQAARRAGLGLLEAWSYLTITNALEGSGRHDLAIPAGREGLARARQLGLGRQIAAPIAGNLAESLTSAGSWDEAVEILDEVLSLDLPPLGRAGPLVIRAQIAVARGDEKTAGQLLAELRSQPDGVRAESQRLLALARLEIDARLASGDIAGALDAGRAALARDQPADPRYLWPLLAAAMRACAEASGGRPPPGTCDPGRLREDLEQLAGSAGRPGPLHEAWAAAFAAEAARAAGRPDLAGWDAAASAWTALAQPEPQAYALLRAASAASAAGDRDGAAARLDRAAGLAGRLGADPLLGQVSSLARRARVDLPSWPGPRGRPQTAAPAGLTERELEVLRLVADGRSNRDIAAELFISPKTASVHVSNILGKLGVSSRGEAAATARRQHLLNDR